MSLARWSYRLVTIYSQGAHSLDLDREYLVHGLSSMLMASKPREQTDHVEQDP